MMRPMSLVELQPLLSAQLLGSDQTVDRVTTDTRSIVAGELFVALRGVSFDAHDYLAEAESKGAMAIVAEDPRAARLPVLQVADTRRALGQIAAFNRSLFAGPVVAVTGSNGKTTVKELLRKIFLQKGAVLATQGNLNNEIGVPLTLLQLSPDHAAAVIELGASGPGEIAWTASLAAPQVSVITNAGEAHMAGFGSHEGLVEAKGEIIDETAANGTVVLNLDDPASNTWRTRAQSRAVLTVSALGNDAADIHAESIRDTADGLVFEACFTSGMRVEVSLPLIGLHNVTNALLAAAAAQSLGVDVETISRGLATAEPVKGRMQQLSLAADLFVIDDSYNANPTAMRAALHELARRRELRIAVVGDMAELGGDEATQHQAVGALAKDLGIERLYATGRHAADYVAGFGAAAEAAQDHRKLVDLLWNDLSKETQARPVTVLVKGSRSAQMDRVVVVLNVKVKA